MPDTIATPRGGAPRGATPDGGAQGRGTYAPSSYVTPSHPRSVSKSTTAVLLGTGGTPGQVSKSTAAVLLGTGGTPGQVSKSTAAVLLGTGGTPGHVSRSAVSVLYGVGLTPGYIGRSSVAVLYEIHKNIDARASVSDLVGPVAAQLKTSVPVRALVSDLVGPVAATATVESFWTLDSGVLVATVNPFMLTGARVVRVSWAWTFSGRSTHHWVPGGMLIYPGGASFQSEWRCPTPHVRAQCSATAGEPLTRARVGLWGYSGWYGVGDSGRDEYWDNPREDLDYWAGGELLAEYAPSPAFESADRQRIFDLVVDLPHQTMRLDVDGRPAIPVTAVPDALWQAVFASGMIHVGFLAEGGAPDAEALMTDNYDWISLVVTK